MAEVIKGTWDNKEIELTNAASEATMLKILAALNKKAADGNKQAKETAKNLSLLQKAAKGASTAVKGLGTAAAKAGEAVGKGLLNTASAAKGLSHELLFGGNRLSDFSSHVEGLIGQLPIFGGVLSFVLQKVTNSLDTQIDAYRELSDSGVSFGSSLYAAQRSAAQTNLTLDAFTDVVTANAVALSMFGGTASTGAEKFTKVVTSISKLAPKLNSLGLTAEETAQFTADYIEQQARLGNAQTMTQRSLEQGASGYILSLDKLSRITGKQRDEVAKELKEQAMDKRLTLIYNNLSSGMKESINIIRSRSPEMADAMIEYIGTGGVPVSNFAKDLSLLSPEIASLTLKLNKGVISQDQFIKGIAKSADKTNNMSEAQARTITLLQNLGEEYGISQFELKKLTGLTGANAKATKQQQDLMTKGASGLLAFEQSITRFRNTLIASLVDSGVFPLIERSFERLAKFLTGEVMTKTLKTHMDTFSKWFGGLMTELEASDNPMELILDKLSTALSKLPGMIWDKMWGTSDTTEEKKKSNASMSEKEVSLNNLKADEQALATPTKNARQIARHGGNQSIKNPTQSVSDLAGDALSNMGPIGVGLAAFAGAIGVGGLVFASIKAFQLLLKGFGTVQVMAGASVIGGLVIGTGKAIEYAGEGLKSAGEGMEKISSAVGDMSKISLTKFNDSLSTSKITNFADAVEELIEQFKDLNKVLAEDNKGSFYDKGTGVSVGTLIKDKKLSSEGFGTETSEGIERLNTTMTQLLTELQTNNKISRQSLNATANLANGMY